MDDILVMLDDEIESINAVLDTRDFAGYTAHLEISRTLHKDSMSTITRLTDALAAAEQRIAWVRRYYLAGEYTAMALNLFDDEPDATPQPAARPVAATEDAGERDKVTFEYLHEDTPVWATNLLEAEYHIGHGNDRAALQSMLDYLMRKAGLEELRAWKEHMVITKGDK